MSEAIIEALRRRYMESVGNPARQLIGGGVRGYLGLDQPEYADQLGREAYANAQALGNTPGVGAPAGAFKAMAAAPLMVKALRNAPRSEALETARQNAVKMLGLPENNTAMDRARALGFTDDVYHSSLKDVKAFEPHGKFAGHQGVSGVSVTDSPEMASRYLDRYADFGWVDGVPNQPFSKNVMPLMVRKGNSLEAAVSPYKSNARLGAPLPENYRNPMIDDGIDTLIVSDAISRKGAVKHSEAKNAIRGNELIVSNPAQLRSRFAAFDPARVNQNDLLGRADPRLLGLIAAGTATGATVAALRNKKEDEKKKKRDE